MRIPPTQSRSQQATESYVGSYTQLQHSFYPKYLEMTLDTTLTYRKHRTSNKLKVGTPNIILRKLTSSVWGADPKLVSTLALALSYWTTEYACPVWHRYVHATQVNVALNDTCRNYQVLAPPPSSERNVVENNEHHSLYGHQLPTRRLKSTKRFLKPFIPLITQPTEARILQWTAKWNSTKSMTPVEALPCGTNQVWAV